MTLFLPFLASTQLWVDSEGYIPTIGDQYILHTTSFPENLELNGTSIWNLSALQIKRSQSVNILDPALNPFGKEFEGSTLCYALGSGNYLFASLEEDGYFKYGGVAGEIGVIMSDPEKFLAFPLKLDRTWSDTFTSNFNASGIDFAREGKVSGKVLSEGTLIMPYGVIPDVLKVSISEDLVDRYDILGTPMELHTHNEITCFIKQGNIEPILTLTSSTINGEETNEYGTFIDGSQVKGTESDGPWREVLISKDDEQRTFLALIAEWKGDLKISLLDKNGKELHSIEQIPVEIGPFELPLPGFGLARYLVIQAIDLDQEALFLLPE